MADINEKNAPRKCYVSPKLEFFGLVSDLTLGGPGSCPDGGQSNNNNVNGNFGGQCY